MKRLSGFLFGVVVLVGALALTVWLVNRGASGGGTSGGDESSGAYEVGADAGPRPRVVATTTIVGDLVRQIGGERVALETLMGPGVDPHQYVATERDLGRLTEADVIVFNGLHLEGKMAELLADLGERGRKTIQLSDGVSPERLRHVGAGGGSHDPHIWFDVGIWSEAAAHLAKQLAAFDPAGAPLYRANAERYLAHLDTLDALVRAEVARIPPDLRILVTAHDAFGYFGAAYGVEVAAIQGISTATEAGSADLQRLADLVKERRVPAIFLETSVPPRVVDALRAAVRDRGFDVQSGGELYSDALGAADGPAGTYAGMVRHNVATIVTALAGPSASTAGSTARSDVERGEHARH